MHPRWISLLLRLKVSPASNNLPLWLGRAIASHKFVVVQVCYPGVCCQHGTFSGHSAEQGRLVHITVQLSIPLPSGRTASQHQLARLERSQLQCNGCAMRNLL